MASSKTPSDPNETEAEYSRLERERFYRTLGYAINRWALIDRALFQIFHKVLGRTEKQSSALFYRSPHLSEHTRLTTVLISASLTAKRAQQWEPIRKQLEFLSEVRNRLAHDPSTHVHFATVYAGRTPRDRPPPRKPQTELRTEASKLLAPGKGQPKPKLTVGDIEAHIREVNALEVSMLTFLAHLPKRPRKRP